MSLNQVPQIAQVIQVPGSPCLVPPNLSGTKPRRSRVKREAAAPPMAMTSQRQQIIELVYHYRALSRDQIQRLTGYASRNTVNYALSLLYQNEFLERRFAQRQRTEGNQAFYLLDRKGAEFLATAQGLDNWHELDWSPQDKNISWWHLPHLVACNEFLIHAAQAARVVGCALDWLPERQLRQSERQAQIEIQVPKSRSQKHGVVADAFVVITPLQGKPVACFFECDRGTVDLSNRWCTKIRVYEAFLQSTLYPKCFPLPPHTVAVVTVTTNENRLAKLKAATERTTLANCFLFATFEDIQSGNLLRDPIWHMSHRNSRYSLLLKA